MELSEKADSGQNRRGAHRVQNEMFSRGDELREIADRLRVYADHLDRADVSLPTADDDIVLGEIARGIYRARRRRGRFVRSELFSDPAWDILLDLFVHRVTGNRVSTTALCVGAEIALTTGLRWIGVLEAEGLVLRRSAHDDNRLTLVELTVEGHRATRNCLREWLKSPG